MYHVEEPIPADAVTVSPVYLLSEDEALRHDEFLDNPYAVSGSNIAKELQDVAEREGRVIYPIQAEADNYNPGEPEDCINQVTNFLEDRLGASVASLYFSGRRSIHGHTTHFVRGEESREWLKQEAEDFCEATSAELDTSIYNRKSMFRLPNVDHEKVEDVEIRKTLIEPQWTHGRIFQEAMSNTAEPPETYHEEFERLTEELEPVTSEGFNAGSEDRPEWIYGHPFSPYGSASGGSRSVSFFRVEGAAYCLRDADAHAFLPAFIHGAVGCDGEYTVRERNAAVKLSKRDYAKLSGAPIGNTYVLIGGQSRSSRVFNVSERIVHDGASILTHSTRSDALRYLTAEGYDIGNSGAKSASGGNVSTREAKSRATEGSSEAEELMRSAERGDYGDLTHNEKFRVACRLLHNGREYAHEWIKQNMRGYDYEETENQLNGILATYGTDYE